MRYYLIAGEASGDLHGGHLIGALREKDPSGIFRAWGGEKMEKAGAEVVKHYKSLAFMGFWEVLINLGTIFKNIKFCKSDILNFKPDALIFIDYPGFNLRIAQWAKSKGIKTIYYISPQIWAWKTSRVHAIKRDIDLMLVILPFEKDFYRRYDYPVTFVGHPLLDEISTQNHSALESSDRIALLPGSRRQEISKILPVMAEVVAFFPDKKFVLACAPGIEIEYYEQYIGEADIEKVFGDTYGVLESAEAAIVTSGTATLETALLGVPQLVVYKSNTINYWLYKSFIKVPYISLVNLIAGRELVREIIQDDCHAANLAVSLKAIIREESKRDFRNKYVYLRERLGGPGASKRAAEAINNFLFQ
jgi:lipid-A-disaccharide synthase